MKALCTHTSAPLNKSEGHPSGSTTIKTMFLHHLNVLGAHISPSPCWHVGIYVKLSLHTFMVFLFSTLLDDTLEVTAGLLNFQSMK
jgi:hypothetical protein